MTLTEKEKEKIIDLCIRQGKSQKHAAAVIGKSLREVNGFIQEYRKGGSDGDSIDIHRELPNVQEDYARFEYLAFKLFDEDKQPVQVAIELKLPGKVVSTFYDNYLNLKGLGTLVGMHKELGNGKIKALDHLHSVMTNYKMDPESYATLLKRCYDNIESLNLYIQKLEEKKQKAIDNYDEKTGPLEARHQALIREIPELESKRTVTLMELAEITKKHQKQKKGLEIILDKYEASKLLAKEIKFRDNTSVFSGPNAEILSMGFLESWLGNISFVTDCTIKALSKESGKALMNSIISSSTDDNSSIDLAIHAKLAQLTKEIAEKNKAEYLKRFIRECRQSESKDGQSWDYGVDE